MKALTNFSPDDGLTQALLRLTVTSTVYCLSDMTKPWGFHVARRDGPAFHLLTSGSAWLEVEGNAGLREIARRTGYESEVSISKAFRRHFGTSPGAYRSADPE